MLIKKQPLRMKTSLKIALVYTFIFPLFSCSGSKKNQVNLNSEDPIDLTFQSTETSIMPATSVPYNTFLTSGDLNGDGLNDIVIGGTNHSDVNAKTPIIIYKNNGNGSLSDITANLLIGAPLPSFFRPQAHIVDLNNDNKNDLVIFDKGKKTRGLDGGFFGAPPLLYLSQAGTTTLTYSSAISTAIATYRQNFLASNSVPPLNCNGSKYFYKFHSNGDCDIWAVADNALNSNSSGAIHSKAQSFGDLDNDGDLDIFIEAGGGMGNGAYGVFLINNGFGVFTPSYDRVSDIILKNNVGMQNGTWRHYDNEFVDIDNDGDDDLILAKLGNKLTGFNFDHNTLKAKILINNGSGYFPDNSVIELPNPSMLTGPNMQYATAGSAVTTTDMNDDGLIDIIVVHTRGSDGTNLGATDWASTGRFVQIIIQTSRLQFEDQTNKYMIDQGDFSNENLRANFPSPHPLFQKTKNLNSIHSVLHVDFDNDGDKDIIFQNVGHMDSQKGNVGFLNKNNRYIPFSIKNFQHSSGNFFYMTGHGLGFADLNNDHKLDAFLVGPFESTFNNNLVILKHGAYAFIQ